MWFVAFVSKEYLGCCLELCRCSFASLLQKRVGVSMSTTAFSTLLSLPCLKMCSCALMQILL